MLARSFPLGYAMNTPAAPGSDAVHLFDARGIARRFRHTSIFAALGVLQPGERMRFVNDHDPLPLIAQLRERYGDVLTVDYVRRDAEAVVIDFGVAG
jgi:uncharacterized protein (DUF2249 family)